MDVDPLAFSNMFTPGLQKPFQTNQSPYLMNTEANNHGSLRGSRQKVNGRARSSTNPLTTDSPSQDSSQTLSKTVSSPTPSTSTPKVQPKPRRGLFSLLASAAQAPPPPTPKSEPLVTEPTATTIDTPTPTPQPAQSSPSLFASIARRLSGSSGKKQVHDLKNPAPQCPRRTLNVNHVRPRVEIKELEKIQLRRVCFVADETLISRRIFKSTEPFETELPREPKLKVKDLKEAYYRSVRNREITPDDNVVKAFIPAKGIELRRLDLSKINFESREAVLPICDVLSLAQGLEEIILDDCGLTDEQLRLFLSALLSLRSKKDDETLHIYGIARLSLAGNETLSIEGWKMLAYFVHMNGDLVSLNISRIPIPLQAAKLLAQAIALPNPSRREIPLEFQLLPICPKPRQRKFSFRRGSASSIGSDIVKISSQETKRQPTLTEEIELIEEKEVLPEIAPHTPMSPSFITEQASTESSVVIVEPPSETETAKTKPQLPRRKVEELKMNTCGVTAETLEPFLKAVTEGGVRYWDVGNNNLGVEGIKLLATLFVETKPRKEKDEDMEKEEEKEEESGRSSPAVESSTESAAQSSTSLSVPDEVTVKPKLEWLSLEGTDLTSGLLDPLLDLWLQLPNLNNLPLWYLDLSNCKLGQDLDFFTRLFTALVRFPNLRVLCFASNPLFSNPHMIKFLREWLPRLSILRRLDIAATGLEAPHLVELARILPDVKTLATLNLRDNPIYDMKDTEEVREGQTEDVSGLTALEAAVKYCRQLIEIELPEGGGDEAARLRHKIFLRCFKNIEFLDQAVHPHVCADPSETAIGRKRATTEEAKELVQQPTKEGRDRYEVDRGHGVARALETVLSNTQAQDKAQDMSLDLLHRARKIKERLQPALLKRNQDETTLRRLRFLNEILTKVIDRFEEAFPDSRHAQQKPKDEHEPESSEDEFQEEQEAPQSPPSPTQIRRSSSMTEIARGLELEEGDVHRFGSLIQKRNIQAGATDLSGEQLLEAILKVDKETVEREVWDKDDLRKVLRKSIDIGSLENGSSESPTREPVEEKIPSFVATNRILTKEKASDTHSI